MRVQNLETIRNQNTVNARCVSRVLRNITDPEAVDPAARLAGTIRWFNSDSDHNPLFDLIRFAFDACFNSNKLLFPGVRDQAYFSARAILRINPDDVVNLDWNVFSAKRSSGNGRELVRQSDEEQTGTNNETSVYRYENAIIQHE